MPFKLCHHRVCDVCTFMLQSTQFSYVLLLYSEILRTSYVPDLLNVLGWTGLFCPCVLFGRNVQALREDIPWTRPCTCHAVCVEGGIALAILTAIFHGVDPDTSILIGEGLVCSWWICSQYTGIIREKLQKKYHLEVLLSLFHSFFVCVMINRIHKNIYKQLYLFLL